MDREVCCCQHLILYTAQYMQDWKWERMWVDGVQGMNFKGGGVQPQNVEDLHP